MPAYITRREAFSASHRLFNPHWSDERNAEVFGPCANPSGHGHNYALEITLTGEVDAETGYLFDLKELSAIAHKTILDDVDHRHLNQDVAWLQGINPTAENLARVFFERLEGCFPDGLLHSVGVIETDKNRAEHRRD